MNTNGPVNDDLKGRLAAAEAGVWTLTQILRAFIRLEILPKDAAKKQILEMLALMQTDDPTMNEADRRFVEVGRTLMEDLVGEPDSGLTPPFSVIQGGKKDD